MRRIVSAASGLGDTTLTTTRMRRIDPTASGLGDTTLTTTRMRRIHTAGPRTRGDNTALTTVRRIRAAETSTRRRPCAIPVRLRQATARSIPLRRNRVRLTLTRRRSTRRFAGATPRTGFARVPRCLKSRAPVAPRTELRRIRGAEPTYAGTTARHRMAKSLAAAGSHTKGRATGEPERISPIERVQAPTVERVAESLRGNGTDHAGARTDNRTLERVAPTSAGQGDFRGTFGQQSTRRPAERTRGASGISGRADALPVHLVASARPGLIRLDRRVLSRAEHRAERDMLRQEFGDGGNARLRRELRDGADRPLSEDPHRRARRHNGGRLDQWRCRRKEPRRSDLERQHGQRADDEDLRVLDLGGERVRGVRHQVENFGQVLQRLRAVVQFVQGSGDRFYAVAPRVRRDGRFPGRLQFRKEIADVGGGLAPVVGDLPHLVFVAVRPIRAGDPAEPFQLAGNSDGHVLPNAVARALVRACEQRRRLVLPIGI
ncbi:hypothetical protein ABZV58_22425 [Nocardia sp. NPDC004654]|uniref:hypothetical protein n=1 Tax=Nocardia sp. NPDC004654 TaxID=3154776 RepID=UPI0033B2FE23